MSKLGIPVKRTNGNPTDMVDFETTGPNNQLVKVAIIKNSKLHGKLDIALYNNVLGTLLPLKS